MDSETGDGMNEASGVMAPQRVFIVEDHPIVCEGLMLILQDSGEFYPCGYIGTAEGAVDRIRECQPDLILLDLSLPDGGGLELLPDILAAVPETKVLIFTVHDPEAYEAKAIRAGARGFLNKSALPTELLTAMRAISMGKLFLNTTRLPETSFKGLTEREGLIYEYIGRGMTGAQIAEALDVSPKTVDAHKANIRAKLDLPDGHALFRSAVIDLGRSRTE